MKKFTSILEQTLIFIAKFLFIIFVVGILALSLRGTTGNITQDTMNEPAFKDEGPLELSPERGRFALTYTLVESKSFQFSENVARFVTPDLGYKDGKYVSLFAPAVSFFTIPGYLIGKYYGASQVGTFAVIGLIAVLNLFLVRSISKELGAKSSAATIAGLIFLFATPAFAYAVTLYQHHITVFLMLSSIYLLLKWDGVWPLFFVWILIGFSVSIDYPNLILFLPIGLYALGRIINFSQVVDGVKLNLKLLGVATVVSILIPAAFFFWTNQSSYGHPLQLAGTVHAVKEINAEGQPLFGVEMLTLEEFTAGLKERKSVSFFKNRNLLHGMYIHLVSDERGILYYTPVIFFAIFGIYKFYLKDPKKTSLLLSILGINLLLYSMWGDPWGGWAFGSRYLIPAYAILSIFVAIALSDYRKKGIILLFFFLLATYSVFVNTLGALTTNKIPPKVEAIALEQVTGIREHYTFFRNWEMLKSNNSKSFVYQKYVYDHLTAMEYYSVITGAIILILSTQITYLYITARKDKSK